ncbi:MAG: gamma-glutamylcyclotransferase [Actinophytocola sp.]|uniref:gamma-glutamylcyclotransferase family protein n=1 Tax=Actinophytocola sp. TaxID=1872138 RepID=UPI00132905D3|nr:gamma-glutamylcyclotransferase family protein [Actinophytocola sp.]MPZ81515.1 gamma-glutamylcyclotransferase [Actinophytocola sp.]
MTFTDQDYPAVPYPGARPGCSFVHDDATGHPLRPDHGTPSGWRLEDGRDLDQWLAERGAKPLTERVPLLCYGSNACPSKLTWLRGTLGLPGPAVLLRARCTGLAAVWAAGLRVVDDQRPATLAAMPGVAEVHAVWLATPEQVRVLDRCEGRNSRYRLGHVTTGEVRLDDGALLDRPLAYVAAPGGTGRTVRHPLLVGGRPVRCAEVPQAAAAALAGEPAPSDGLSLLVVDGAPVPEDHPPRLFVYGTLRPGASHWPMLEPHAAGEPRRASLRGTLFDTGRGYPALRLGDGPGVSGWVVELARPAAALSTVDEYEGEEYHRVRVTLAGGAVAWTYVWIDPIDGMPALSTPWGATRPAPGRLFW